MGAGLRQMPRSIVFVIAIIAAASASAADIYLSPDGSDDASGLSPNAPIATLARAEIAVKQATAAEPRDVAIYFAPGRYTALSAVWRYTMPAHSIRFIGAADGASVLDGAQRGLTFFTLRGSTGAASNLSFENLTITRYVTAISLNGDREDFARSNANNVIRNNRFLDIGGTSFPTLGRSTAVVRLVNSDRNVIDGNTFRGMVAADCALLHAIYLAHNSSNNVISNNSFESGCGDPIRVRDASHDNRIVGNTFINAGDRAAYSEWFCGPTRPCTKRGAECPSRGNAFQDNDVRSGFGGKALAATSIAPIEAHRSCK